MDSREVLRRQRLLTLVQLVHERALSADFFEELCRGIATFYPGTVAILAYDGLGPLLSLTLAPDPGSLAPDRARARTDR